MFAIEDSALLVVSTVIYTASCAQSVSRLNNSRIACSELDRKITELMKAARVQGLGISIFNNNTAVYTKAFGFKQTSLKAPLRTSTNFYGASLSKAVFAVLAMKLVEKGVLDLDKPLQGYLDTPIYRYAPATRWHDHYSDLEQDSLYTEITARIRITSLQQHGALCFKDSTLNDSIALSAGLGWLLLQSPYGVGFFKEGHGDGFQH
jgi:D-alanyl-D-alanine-carboxypeptidase/D-alanyl-D-alanine-endopeptidase